MASAQKPRPMGLTITEITEKFAFALADDGQSAYIPKNVMIASKIGTIGERREAKVILNGQNFDATKWLAVYVHQEELGDNVAVHLQKPCEPLLVAVGDIVNGDLYLTEEEILTELSNDRHDDERWGLCDMRDALEWLFLQGELFRGVFTDARGERQIVMWTSDIDGMIEG